MSSLDLAMSQMVLYTGVDTGISRLEALPEEIRRQILRYILHSRYARLARPDRRRADDTITHLRAFDWTIGTLRVCRTLYNDGFDILNRENKWIKLVLFIAPDELYPALLNHDVHCIRQNAATNDGNQHTLATITIKRQVGHVVRAETVLLPLEQLVTFCWFLRAMDMGNSMEYNFRFDIPEELSGSLQRQILLPFTPLTGERLEQEVEIIGHVAPYIRAQIISSMTSWIGWARAKGWDIYNVAEQIKRDGDAAWLDGDLKIAAYKYGQATGFWDEASAGYHSDYSIDSMLTMNHRHCALIIR